MLMGNDPVESKKFEDIKEAGKNGQQSILDQVRSNEMRTCGGADHWTVDSQLQLEETNQGLAKCLLANVQAW